MGWTFCRNKTVQQLVLDHIKLSGTRIVEKHILVKHSTNMGEVNFVLWCLNKTTTGQKYISCITYMLEGGEWGYNGFCESSYPYYFSCPLEYLDECPVTSQEWRNGVKEYWNVGKTTNS